MSTAIVWFRRDLRVHDHPALARAAREHDHVVPVFVFDRTLLGGRFASANRTAFMLDCLHALDGELRERGARLYIRDGDAATEIPKLVEEAKADALYATEETTGYARRRDDAIAETLGEDFPFELEPGTYIAELDEVRTKQGKPYTVFTPFSRTWLAQPRRKIERAPRELHAPSRLNTGRIPSLKALGFPADAPELVDRPEPGERGAQRMAENWLKGPIDGYDSSRDVLAKRTSRLSAALRFGTLSSLWLEDKVAARAGRGAKAFRIELAWRDFYGSVQLHYPETTRQEFVERYRKLEWRYGDRDFEAWCEGRTGYPVVDAAMRQLLAMGWMHNRARMIVGSFLTKDLHQDWRRGEQHFMRHLLDGDVGSNNGGWQWIASTGTDPAPYFQRLFNPTTQQEKFDPKGRYVRRWVPELEKVPDDKLATPWEMSEDEQRAAGCVIGEDYPEPIVDHKVEREEAMRRYRAVR